MCSARERLGGAPSECGGFMFRHQVGRAASSLLVASVVAVLLPQPSDGFLSPPRLGPRAVPAFANESAPAIGADSRATSTLVHGQISAYYSSRPRGFSTTVRNTLNGM